MITLRGITWDHPRGIDPLRAAARTPTVTAGGSVRVSWEARPLHEFEDTPLDELGRRYDLLAIDHPLIGDSCRPRPALCDVTELVSEEVLDDAQQGSVGPSFRSYQWQGHQYALPIDAAAQVAAYRSDLVGASPPSTWAELDSLAAELPPGRSIAIAANPTHLYLSWLSLCHQYAARAWTSDLDDRRSWWTDEGPESAVGESALVALYRLLDLCTPESLRLNPIGLLDRMATDEDIAYAPLVFGYCTYGSNEPGRHRLRFGDPPSRAGTVLGGVGIAVSARSRHPEAAARVVEQLVSGSYQRTGYVSNGGQPAHQDAWRDPAVNRSCNDFFSATHATLERSFIRPRCAGYPAFQRSAGELLHRAATQRRPVEDVVARIREAWGDLDNSSGSPRPC